VNPTRVDEVPLAWFTAECRAHDLAAGLTWPRDQELSAAEGVLALTLFLSGMTTGGEPSTEQLAAVLSQLTGNLRWCACRFETLADGLGSPDVRLAARVWNQLVKPRVGDAPKRPPAVGHLAGLNGARYIVRLHLRTAR
jgi:hypothetical protein